MNHRTRPFTENDLEAIIEISLLAWEPVFESFAKVLGPNIFPIIYPDWRAGQRDGIVKTCRDEKYRVLVAEAEAKVVGFLAYSLMEEARSAEIYYLAVHPDYQNIGVGTGLNRKALEEMKAKGIQLVVVGTGGDEGHAPARRCYEKSGFTPLPLVRYYQKL